jgi:uncharacterized protein
VLPVLASLIAVQQLDTAAEAARRRLAELPTAELAIDRSIATAQGDVDQAKAALVANVQSRREIEKLVAAVDSRLARFDDHKAAVKTNQEFTALLHEIETAKAEKDAFEEQILILMEAADTLTTAAAEAGRVLTETQRAGEAVRQALAAERHTLDGELARLMSERAVATKEIAAPVLAKYEQLLKQRKMVAVAQMRGDICTACHVRLRPAVTQLVRRNSDIVACDSCQRMLYFTPDPIEPVAEASAPPAG